MDMAAFKVHVAIEAINEVEELSELIRRFDINPQLLSKLEVVVTIARRRYSSFSLAELSGSSLSKLKTLFY